MFISIFHNAPALLRPSYLKTREGLKEGCKAKEEERKRKKFSLKRRRGVDAETRKGRSCSLLSEALVPLFSQRVEAPESDTEARSVGARSKERPRQRERAQDCFLSPKPKKKRKMNSLHKNLDSLLPSPPPPALRQQPLDDQQGRERPPLTLLLSAHAAVAPRGAPGGCQRAREEEEDRENNGREREQAERSSSPSQSETNGEVSLFGSPKLKIQSWSGHKKRK